MKIKQQKYGTGILMQVHSSLGECIAAYFDPTRKDIQQLFELKKELSNLYDKYKVISIQIVKEIYWLENTDSFEEVEELNYITVPNGIPEDKLPEVRNEGTECEITSWGILFSTYYRHTTEKLCSEEIPWDFLQRVLDNFDPQSVRFIKED